jgi:mono/diheme cytochrome c family protein
MNKPLTGSSIALLLGLLLVPMSASADDVGKTSYDIYCATCHGATGGGDGAAGASLDPKPASFSDAKFWATRDDALVTKAIKEGGAAIGKSPMMIAWGAVLDDAKIAAVVKHLKTFKK